MLQTKEYEIPSCDDAELGLKRDSKLHFMLSWDDEKEIKALVCVVPGLGGDAKKDYKEHLIESIAENLPVAVMSVDYHCIGLNPEHGATPSVDERDTNIFLEHCRLAKFDLGNENDFREKAKDFRYFDSALGSVNQVLGALKQAGQIDKDALMHVSVTLKPTKNEYQNFGIMSATDVINALLYIKQTPPFNTGGGICLAC